MGFRKEVAIIERKHQIDVVVLQCSLQQDSKDFDSVRHDMLVTKLKELGVHSKLLGWVRSFLSDRQQYVNT